MCSVSSSTTCLGVIVQLDLTDVGYYKLVVRTQTPFDFKYLRFNVWNTKSLTSDGERAKVGEYVKVVYETEIYKELKSLERVSLKSCENCGAFLERNNVRSRLRSMNTSVCKHCSNLSSENKMLRVDAELKLISKTEKMFKYSPGTCLLFVDEGNEKHYLTTVFKNDPIYLPVKDLIPKSNYTVQGWAAIEKHRYFLKLMSVQRRPSLINPHQCTSCENTYKNLASLSTHKHRYHPYRKN